MSRIFIGEIAEEGGMICLQTASNCWFPLGGNSVIAREFRTAFNGASPHDLGKRLWRVNGVLQMENAEQALARLNTPRAYGEPTPFRVYAGGRAVIYAHDLKQRHKPLRDVVDIRQAGMTPAQFSTLLEKIESAVRAAILELEL